MSGEPHSHSCLIFFFFATLLSFFSCTLFHILMQLRKSQEKDLAAVIKTVDSYRHYFSFQLDSIPVDSLFLAEPGSIKTPLKSSLLHTSLVHCLDMMWLKKKKPRLDCLDKGTTKEFRYTAQVFKHFMGCSWRRQPLAKCHHTSGQMTAWMIQQEWKVCKYSDKH